LDQLDKDPDAVVLLGDTAYHRSKVGKEMGFGLPKKLASDGTQLIVRFLVCIFFHLELTASKGTDITASHRVQSQRAVVEQSFADVKKNKILDFNKIVKVANLEKDLDCVLSLHNFRKLSKLKPGFMIERRRAMIPGEHIFRPIVPAKDVDLRIPKEISKQERKKYPHVQRFIESLPSLVPGIKKALDVGGKESFFFPNVAKRGRFLHEGAYVLQLCVQQGPMDQWSIKYRVGASYSYETHQGYCDLSKDYVEFNICDCYAG
jgi:hypothetical protein